MTGCWGSLPRELLLPLLPPSLLLSAWSPPQSQNQITFLYAESLPGAPHFSLCPGPGPTVAYWVLHYLPSRLPPRFPGNSPCFLQPNQTLLHSLKLTRHAPAPRPLQALFPPMRMLLLLDVSKAYYPPYSHLSSEASFSLRSALTATLHIPPHSLCPSVSLIPSSLSNTQQSSLTCCGYCLLFTAYCLPLLYKNRDSYLVCSLLYPLCLEEWLAHSRCSVN